MLLQILKFHKTLSKTYPFVPLIYVDMERWAE